MKNNALKASQYSIELSVDSETQHLPVVFRKHPTSQHMVIRYQPLQHLIAVTLPRYVTIRQGLHFIEEKRNWIAQQILERAERVPFADGTILPVLGMNYSLRHVGGRGIVHIDGDSLIVPGDISFMERRVREWLKKHVRDEITRLAAAKAHSIGKMPGRVSVRDTRSRWGSCSPDGSLSFSWRLVFAPFDVFEYVVCHEVAHLKHHNHSKAFWDTVELLHPEHEKAQKWLRTHGPTLHSYG